MKIKKDGKVINLTESDIKKIKGKLLKEQSDRSLEQRVSKLEDQIKELMMTIDVRTNPK
jgi:hypothetical protein